MLDDRPNHLYVQLLLLLVYTSHSLNFETEILANSLQSWSSNSLQFCAQFVFLAPLIRML